MQIGTRSTVLVVLLALAASRMTDASGPRASGEIWLEARAAAQALAREVLAPELCRLAPGDRTERTREVFFRAGLLFNSGATEEMWERSLVAQEDARWLFAVQAEHGLEDSLVEESLEGLVEALEVQLRPAYLLLREGAPGRDPV